MWSIIRYLWNNKAVKTLLWNIISFSKDGYNKHEIAELVRSLLAIFKIPVSVAYVGNEVQVRFTWK